MCGTTVEANTLGEALEGATNSVVGELLMAVNEVSRTNHVGVNYNG